MTHDPMTQSHNEDSTPQTRAALAIGGALAAVGGLGYLTTLIVHGDLPDRTTEVALEHIAGRPEWRTLKLALVTSLMCWLGAFTVLGSTLRRGASATLARWAAAVATVGVAVVVVEYAIIGHALKDVADAWRANPADTRQLHLGEIMLAASGGLFYSFIAWMLGLPFVLVGLAIARSEEYPRWFGWPAVIAGLGALMAGAALFLGAQLMPFPVLYGGFVFPANLWLIALGVLMWRRSRR